jgi:hypothetical protein
MVTSPDFTFMIWVLLIDGKGMKFVLSVEMVPVATASRVKPTKKHPTRSGRGRYVERA